MSWFSELDSLTEAERRDLQVYERGHLEVGFLVDLLGLHGDRRKGYLPPPNLPLGSGEGTI